MELDTLRAVLDLYGKCVGEQPGEGGVQTLILWLAAHGEAVLRESIRTLQTARLTRTIATDPLRYLGGILKHKAKEAEERNAQKKREGKGGYYDTVPKEYQWLVIG